MYYKKGVLRNFAKFTGKHLYHSLFFNKVAALRHESRLWHRCFPVNFTKFLRTPFLIEHLWWLLQQWCKDYPTIEYIISVKLLVLYYIKISTKKWHYQKFPRLFILIRIFTFSMFTIVFFRLFCKIIWITVDSL